MRFDDYRLEAKYKGIISPIEIEQLYQAFKKRLIQELSVESEEWLYSGGLIDTEDPSTNKQSDKGE